MDTTDAPCCEDCGRSFPLLDTATASTCMKCIKLAKLEIASEDYTEIQMKWLQCDMCGLSCRNMVKSTTGVQLCGSRRCISFASETMQVVPLEQHGNNFNASATPTPNAVGTTTSVSIPETHTARALATRERMRLSISTRNNIIAPGTSLTTLALARQEQASPNQHVYISFRFRKGSQKTTDTKLGHRKNRFSLSNFLPDVKQHMLNTLNVEWVKLYDVPLNINETSIHFSGNELLDNGTNTLSIREFLEYYSSPDKAGVHLYASAADKKSIGNTGKIPVLSLELYIHLDLYDKRMSLLEKENKGNKRRTRSDSFLSAPVTSRFLRSTNGQRVPSSSLLITSSFILSTHKDTSVINKITCTLDASSGLPSFNELDEKLIGYLQDRPFATGSMKCAYELIIRGTDGTETVYAAKRFFRLSNDDDENDAVDKFTLITTPVDPVDHNTQIKAECMRMQQGKWFLSAFRQHCQAAGIAIDEGVAFADAFLIRECGIAPSPASSLGENSTTDLIWLVEKRRSTNVERFSGTLVHPSNRNDLRASTIYALAHFIYGHSKRTTVFADIQGTPAQVKGRDGLLLFDPMTHTRDGESGIGDFGPDGIATFTRDHRCSTICHRLGLNKGVPLREDEEDSQTESSDNENHGDQDSNLDS